MKMRHIHLDLRQLDDLVDVKRFRFGEMPVAAWAALRLQADDFSRRHAFLAMPFMAFFGAAALLDGLSFLDFSCRGCLKMAGLFELLEFLLTRFSSLSSRWVRISTSCSRNSNAILTGSGVACHSSSVKFRYLFMEIGVSHRRKKNLARNITY